MSKSETKPPSLTTYSSVPDADDGDFDAEDEEILIANFYLSVLKVR